MNTIVLYYVHPLDTATNKFIAEFMGQNAETSFARDMPCNDDQLYSVWKCSPHAYEILKRGAADGKLKFKTFVCEPDDSLLKFFEIMDGGVVTTAESPKQSAVMYVEIEKRIRPELHAMLAGRLARMAGKAGPK